MERDEFRKIVKGLKAVYADPKFIADQDAFDMWYALLSDLPYEEAAASAHKYMMQEKYPPTPSDIRAGLVKVQMKHELNSNEAWALVYKAISNSTYHSVEEYEKLPPIVQKAVGSPANLRTMAMDETFNSDVQQSHFTRVYNTRLKEIEEEAKISRPVRDLLESTVTQMIGVEDGST